MRRTTIITKPRWQWDEACRVQRTRAKVLESMLMVGVVITVAITLATSIGSAELHTLTSIIQAMPH